MSYCFYYSCYCLHYHHQTSLIYATASQKKKKKKKKKKKHIVTDKHLGAKQKIKYEININKNSKAVHGSEQRQTLGGHEIDIEVIIPACLNV